MSVHLYTSGILLISHWFLSAWKTVGDWLKNQIVVYGRNLKPLLDEDYIVWTIRLVGVCLCRLLYVYTTAPVYIYVYIYIDVVWSEINLLWNNFPDLFSLGLVHECGRWPMWDGKNLLWFASEHYLWPPPPPPPLAPLTFSLSLLPVVCFDSVCLLYCYSVLEQRTDHQDRGEPEKQVFLSFFLFFLGGW